MYAFFSNFIIALLLVGAVSRVLNWLLPQKITRPYLYTFGFLLLFGIPMTSFFLGFDTAISIYLPSFLVWLLIDYVHAQIKGGKK